MTGIRWSVSTGISGQFVPELGGQLHRNLHLDESLRNQRLRWICLLYAQENYLDEALDIYNELTNDWKEYCFDDICVQYAKKGKFEQALKISNYFSDSIFLPGLLSRIAAIYSIFGYKSKSETLLQESLTLCHKTREEPDKSIKLLYISKSLAFEGLFEKAIEIANTIDEIKYNSDAKKIIAVELFKKNQTQEAFKIAELIPQKGIRNNCWSELAICHYNKNGIKSAIKHIDIILNKESKQNWIKGVIQCLKYNEIDKIIISTLIVNGINEASNIEMLLETYVGYQYFYQKNQSSF